MASLGGGHLSKRSLSRLWSIRNLDWSYILWLNASDRDADEPELYDRRNDLYEQRNVIAEYPEVAGRLELELRRFVAGLK